MNNEEALNLNGVLNMLMAKEAPTRFSYVAVVMRKRLEPVVEALRTAQANLKPSAAFVEYEKKRIELCRKYAQKDSNGEPMVSNNEYVIPDMPAFDAALEALRKDGDYVEVIAERDAELAKYQTILKEPCEVVLTKLREEDLPKSMSPMAMQGLLPIMPDMDAVPAKP